VGLRTIWDNLTPLLYAAVGVAFSEGMRLLVVAFNQRMVDHETHRQQRKDDSKEVQLRRIDDLTAWRQELIAEITTLKRENAEKDKRIDDVERENAQLRGENTNLIGARDWYKERYVAVGQELNELKFKRRQDDT
jgi:predicted nuclease with TOPRIM domain